MLFYSPAQLLLPVLGRSLEPNVIKFKAGSAAPLGQSGKGELKHRKLSPGTARIFVHPISPSQLHQPALLHGSLNEASKQGVRFEWAALEFRMELDADEPWMIRPLNDFGQRIIG